MAVVFFVRSVPGETGAIVLQHRSDDERVVDGGSPLGEVLVALAAGSPPYHSTGWAVITLSGTSGWVKKNPSLIGRGRSSLDRGRPRRTGHARACA
jgi:hypothetical protein